MPESQAGQDTNPDIEFRKALGNKNIAKDLSKEKLEKLSLQVKNGFETDLASRSDWEKTMMQATELAMQVKNVKNFPWPGASNVKYPLLSTAAMQFAARAYPSLVPSNGKVVNSKVIGADPTGEKKKKADRVADYMSFQIMHEMLDWEEDMDKLLMTLPIIGTMFKKTYFSPAAGEVKSCLVHPKDLVVNYWATTIEDCERVSELIDLSPRIVKERQRQGLFLDIDLGDPVIHADRVDTGKHRTNMLTMSGSIDETTPYEFVEQHTFADLDDDGYEEPYIVTFLRETGEIVRIVARFTDKDIETEDDSAKIIRIEPTHYYTKFSFVPNPDGSFYGIGFGVLLGPLNEAVNTLINQLVDAGTASNLQGGFIGKGLKLKTGDSRFTPGEWKPVNATGDDLRKQIVPLPAKDPSTTLFQLMGSLVTSGKELASVAEIFTGKMPGQNTPATTTMASVEQGMKVFTAVYKRIFRSLSSEFKKIYMLNGVYLNPNTYADILDEPVGPEDFDSEGYDVCPGADPNAVSSSEKLMKAQGLLEMLPIGTLDPIEVTLRVLEAQEQPNVERLMAKAIQETGEMPPPPPDPKMLEMQMKSQMEQQKIQMQGQAQQQKMELESRDAQQKQAMQAQSHAQEMQQKVQMNQVEAATALHKQRIFQVEGQQKLQQNEQNHQQSMQLKEKAASAQRSQPKSGTTGKPKK